MKILGIQIINNRILFIFPSIFYIFFLFQANSADNLEEEKKRIYKTAYEILYMEKPSLFPNEPPLQVKSSAYIEYEQKKAAYQNAVSNFNTVKANFDLSKPEEQRKWLVQASSLQNDIDNSWKDWISANKEDIEQAIAITNKQ